MTDKLTKLALFFAFFALSSVSICASEPIDSIASDTTTVLGEVYVSAPTIKTFANRMEIFMPERNRNYGTNALDAISSLPQFRKPIMGDQLTTPEGTPIFLLIDGKSASYNELMAVRPENIAKLVFYDPAPARYSVQGATVVLDVVTRRPKEAFYSAYLNTLNSVTTLNGGNYISLNYLDSANYVSAYYNLGYRRTSGERINQTYDYGDEKYDYAGIKGEGKDRGLNHTASLMWKHNRGGNLFYANVNYNNGYTLNYFPQHANATIDGTTLSGNRVYDNDYRTNSISLDLYYHHYFSKHKWLAVNVVNSYFHHHSVNDLKFDFDTESSIIPTERMFTDLRNNSYSLKSEISYNTRIGHGYWSVSGFYTYYKTRQRMNDNTPSTVDYSGASLATEYSGYIPGGKFSYYASLTLSLRDYRRVSGKKDFYIIPRPYLMLTYTPSRSATLQFSTFYSRTYPQAGMLSDSYTQWDYRYYSAGNPSLKPYDFFNAALTFIYSTPDNRLYLKSSLQFRRSFSPFETAVVKDGDNYVSMPVQVESQNRYTFSLSPSYTPVKWLSLMPSYSFTYRKYYSKSQPTHSFTGWIYLMFGEWTGKMGVSTPSKNYNGDFCVKTYTTGIVGAEWKHKSISAGINYYYAPHSFPKTYIDKGDFHMSSIQATDFSKNMVELTFTYFFSHGKQIKTPDKQLSNSESDSGFYKQF